MLPMGQQKLTIRLDTQTYNYSQGTRCHYGCSVSLETQEDFNYMIYSGLCPVLFLWLRIMVTLPLVGSSLDAPEESN